MEKEPDSYKSPLQERAYESLEKLQISFKQMDADEAISMEDCIDINGKLEMKTAKTLFLCNRQKKSNAKHYIVRKWELK